MPRFYNVQFPDQGLTRREAEKLRHDLEFVLGDYGVQPSEIFTFITQDGKTVEPRSKS